MAIEALLPDKSANDAVNILKRYGFERQGNSTSSSIRMVRRGVYGWAAITLNKKAVFLVASLTFENFLPMRMKGYIQAKYSVQLCEKDATLEDLIELASIGIGTENPLDSIDISAVVSIITERAREREKKAYIERKRKFDEEVENYRKERERKGMEAIITALDDMDRRDKIKDYFKSHENLLFPILLYRDMVKWREKTATWAYYAYDGFFLKEDGKKTNGVWYLDFTMTWMFKEGFDFYFGSKFHMDSFTGGKNADDMA